MTVKVLRFPGDADWARCYSLALATEGKESGGKVPSGGWKLRILRAEHSPIRTLIWTVRMTDVPYWVAMHLVRHKHGVEWHVSSQRNDRQSRYDRNAARQDEPITLVMEANAQALISISRKRLCHKAAPETRALWADVVEAIRAVSPEMLSVLVPDCVYRGECREMRPCGLTEGEKA